MGPRMLGEGKLQRGEGEGGRAREGEEEERVEGEEEEEGVGEKEEGEETGTEIRRGELKVEEMLRQRQALLLLQM